MFNYKPLIIVALLSAAVYGNTLFNGFVWDDYGLIMNETLVQQANIKNLFSPEHYKNIPQEERGRLRPMRVLTFIADRLIYGANAWGYHLTNLLLNTSCAILVYLAALALFKNQVAALLSAAFFCVHPAHVESVAWVKNRSDILCAIFFLLSLLAVLKLEGAARILAVFGSFTAAFLSKEIAVMIPLVIMLMMYVYYSKEEFKKNIGWVAGLFVLAAVLLVLKEVYWKKELMGGSGVFMDAYVQMRIVLYTLSKYFNILLVPVFLSVEHDVNLNVVPAGAVSWGMLVFAAAGLYIAGRYSYYRYIKQENDELSKNLLFGYGFMMLAFIPISNIVFLESRPIAEQRLYLPSIGFSFLIGNIAGAFSGQSEVARLGDLLKDKAVLFMAVILVLFSVLTVQRNFVWKNDLSFWKEAAAVNPGHFRPNANLALIYYAEGDYEKAVKYFEVSGKHANRAEFYYMTGMCYNFLDRYDRAIENYERFIKMSPNPKPDVYNNLGIVYDKMYVNYTGKKNSPELSEYRKFAEENYAKAIKLDSEYKEAWFNLAQFYAKTDRKALARKELLRFISAAKDINDKKEAEDTLKEIEYGN